MALQTNNVSKLPLLVLILALGGCSLAPQHERPEPPLVATWSGSAVAGTSDAATLGWSSFIQDEQLRQLVGLALDNNRSLRQALLDIEAARAQYRITRSSRLPSINAQGQGSRQRLPADLSATGSSGVQGSYQVGLGLTAFELDLFGRVANLSESALQEFLASEEAARGVRLGLVAEASRAYLSLRAGQQALDISRQTLASREESLALISLRRDTGSASELEYQEVQSLLESARAEVQRSTRTLALARNALELLVAAPLPAELERRTGDDSPLFQEVMAGLPSQLLEQRPDILAAEYRLVARQADIGAARAAFFPSISLTGLYGSASSELSGLFESGSRTWQFVPQINLPIFTAGRNRANLNLAQVRRDQAVAEYELAVQTAFSEVSDALIGRETLVRQEQAQAALDASNARAVQLSEMRYEGGIDSYEQYLDIQRRSFADRLALVEARRERELAMVSLYAALGGGWRE